MPIRNTTLNLLCLLICIAALVLVASGSQAGDADFFGAQYGRAVHSLHGDSVLANMSNMETVLKLKIDAADYRGPLLHAEFLGTIPLSVNAAE